MGAKNAGGEMSDIKEKLKKLEERIYTHDEKFAQQQVDIDTTSCNLKMQLMGNNEGITH